MIVIPKSCRILFIRIRVQARLTGHVPIVRITVAFRLHTRTMHVHNATYFRLVFLGTVDAHLVALSAKTGAVLWDVPVADSTTGYAITSAPLIVKDMVITGIAGGEYGIRGFLDAYDAATGKRRWRFNTIPGPGEPGHETWQAGDAWEHGGGAVWVTGSYDPALNLTYWGTGNPGPDWNSHQREGDNLYSDSVVALDADTGKLKWYFQFTPHDLYDYDATQIPILLDTQWEGRPRKLLVQANRNGFLYVLDRTDGKFLFAKPFGKVTWAAEIGAKRNFPSVRSST